MRSYAIGDIHGHLDKLLEVQDRVAADKAQVGDRYAPVVHLGDFVDRGPDSAGVLTHLARGVAAGAPWVLMKGNHDRLMRLFLYEDPRPDPARPGVIWLDRSVGGRETLASYGIDVSPDVPIAEIHAQALARVPQDHVDLLDALKPGFRYGGVFFCHAGILPGVALEAQIEDDLIWIRDLFHMDRRDHGALIVHGHTPIKAVTHYGNRVNLDTGAAYGGPLSAVVIEGGAVFVLTEDGRRPLLPKGR
ncbi:serine/threonine protein phosphatase 1 [Rhodovulum iodosum]|uniref:Serine/threonine protein phosphatase 1 n=1 Tax=Rhodovulum iodosum TaxID=68291 RepID=A0ABV3XT79_9RHOB|nr:metallophosphoesterase [Rhodovulum robiginosum]RSK32988.1 serine/threonine protein phosphatase [Rhodovulum robiginosum]